MKKLFIQSWLIGIVLTVAFVIIGLFPRVQAICETVLAPANYIANALPGGGIHNPLAIPIGILAEGALFGVPVAAMLYILQEK